MDSRPAYGSLLGAELPRSGDTARPARPLGGGRARAVAIAIAVAVAVLQAAPDAARAESTAGFLTEPSAGDPAQVALDYLRDRQLARRAGAGETAEWELRDRHTSAHSGVTHLYFRQLIGGIEVHNGDVTLGVMPDGRLAGLRTRSVAQERVRARPRIPAISAAEAVGRAALRLGLAPGPISVLERPSGPERTQVLGAPQLTPDPIPVQLRYLDQAGGLRLVWSFDLRLRDGRYWWELNVDAVEGEVRTARNRVRNDQYRVFALPLEDPDDGPRTLELDPADPAASPFGWHDLDGIPGAETTESDGNNVFAASNEAMGALVLPADGGAGLDFDFPLDLTLTPDGYQLAAVTNLFYWNNVLHDLHLQYGFDEAAGNFQSFHYGPSAVGAGDEVVAFAQDFNDENNASMATPADGSEPIMRMHVFSLPVLGLSAPPAVAGRYEAGAAEFGPDLDAGGLTGDVALALDPADGAGPSVTDACSPLTNPAEVAGRIALVDRGSCDFIVKVDHAETAGAIGVIVANHVDGGVITMAKPQGNTPKIDVPSIFVRKVHGLLIKDALGLGTPVTASLLLSVRDADLDAGVIVHEYGHGVSTRLTGGSSNASCLLGGQSAGMGEGWSDFWALALTAKPGDAGADPQPLGAYLVGEPGIRNFPYSTDLAVNPQTFIDISSTNAPHGVGEIWALALWELHWVLVDDFGFDPDLYFGTGGNNVALQLVMDALKLQPCTPSFVEARNALLLADTMAYGQAHQCRIWSAFAKRGLGSGANATPDPMTGLVTESFALPPECPLCGDVDGNGLTDPADVDLLRAELAFPGTLTPAEFADCAARSFSGSCDVAEVARLRRGLADLAPGLDGGCAAAP